jgi:hypothetical protein
MHHQEGIMSAEKLRGSVIFPIGDKLESENFKGTVWLNMLTPFGSACPIGNVTFEPSCRNNWHKHAGGQANLHVGNDRARLIDVITQLLPFIGYPRALNALKVINEVTEMTE